MPALKRKRKPSSSTGPKSPKQPDLSIHEKSVCKDDEAFTSVIKNCGITLNKNGNNASDETTKIQQVINKLFCSKDSEFVDSFISALDIYSEDNEHFVSLLLPTIVDISTDNLSQSCSPLQDSVMKLLLQCDKIQSEVIEFLFRKIPIFSEEENLQFKNNPSVANNGQVGIVNIPRLILNQLRWINYFVQPDKVANQLIETSSVMQPTTAFDIISFVPDVLMNVGDHSLIAKDLCEMLNIGPSQITSAVFDAISNLSISPETIGDIQEIALSYLSTAEIEQIYHATKFLLDSCSTIEMSKKIISALRPHLNYPELIKSFESDEDKVKPITKRLATCVFAFMNSNHAIFQAWLQVLDSLSKDDWLSGDLIASIQLCDVTSATKRKSATLLLTARLKKNSISRKVLNKCFMDSCYLLEDHHLRLCKIAQSLLWSADRTLKNFSARLYLLMIISMNEAKRKEVIGVVLEHVGSLNNGSYLEVDIALKTLFKVALDKPEFLEPYLEMLYEITEHLDSMSLSQVRLSVTILSVMKSHIKESKEVSQTHKRLNSFTTSNVNIDIISIAASILAETINQNDEDQMMINLKDTLGNLDFRFSLDPNFWSIFFEEISIAVTNDGYTKLPSKVFKYLKDFAFNKFTSLIFLPNDKDSFIKLKDRFALLDDLDQMVNLSRCSRPDTNMLINMCRLIRALSGFCSSLEGSLISLKPFLLHPILIHDESYEEPDTFESLTKDEASFVLDQLFTAVNWSRELISIFSSSHDVINYVIERLRLVCKLQTRIMKLLDRGPFIYTPAAIDETNHYPKGQKCSLIKTQLRSVVSDDEFSSSIKSSKISSQKSSTQKSSTQKSSTQKSSTQKSMTQKSMTQKRSKTRSEKILKSSLNLFAYNQQLCLVEVGFEVSQLLRHQLKIGSTPDEMDGDVYLGVDELYFLLSDLSNKIVHVDKRSKTGFAFKSVDMSKAFTKLNSIKTDDFFVILTELWPSLCSHIDCLLIRITSEVEESQLSTTNCEDLIENETAVSCYLLLCDILLQIILWVKKNSGKSQLFDIFLSNVSKQRENDKNPNRILKNMFKYIEKLLSELPTATSASTIIKILYNLVIIIEEKKSEKSSQLRKTVINACDKILQRDWSIADSGPSINAMISTVFHTKLQLSQDPLEVIEDSLQNIICHLFKDCEKNPFLDEEKDTEDVVYPCVTKQNFSIIHMKSLEALVEVSGTFVSLSSSASEDQKMNSLLQWSEAIKVFDLLAKILKLISKRNMMTPMLKLSQSLIENFIKKGIPLCELTFKDHQEDIIRMLKCLQGATRQLQHLTCHSKVIKDSTLTGRVPALKRTLETFVFRVKALLTLHDCHNAFWLGNLKNRNLQGEEISTQKSISSDEDISDVDSVMSGTLF